MAASMATSLSSLSHRLSLRPQPLLLRHLPHKTSFLSFPSPPPSPSPLLSLRCTPPEAEANPEQEQEQDQDPAALEGATPSFEGPLFDWPEESEEEIAKGYERLYGPAFSGESFLGGNVYQMDGVLNRIIDEFDNLIISKPVDDFEERVVQVRRVTKVVKGGKNLSFRAVVVVGDKKGHVGVNIKETFLFKVVLVM